MLPQETGLNRSIPQAPEGLRQPQIGFAKELTELLTRARSADSWHINGLRDQLEYSIGVYTTDENHPEQNGDIAYIDLKFPTLDQRNQASQDSKRLSEEYQAYVKDLEQFVHGQEDQQWGNNTLRITLPVKVRDIRPGSMYKNTHTPMQYADSRRLMLYLDVTVSPNLAKPDQGEPITLHIPVDCIDTPQGLRRGLLGGLLGRKPFIRIEPSEPPTNREAARQFASNTSSVMSNWSEKKVDMPTFEYLEKELDPNKDIEYRITQEKGKSGTFTKLEIKHQISQEAKKNSYEEIVVINYIPGETPEIQALLAIALVAGDGGFGPNLMARRVNGTWEVDMSSIDRLKEPQKVKVVKALSEVYKQVQLIEEDRKIRENKQEFK